MRGATLIVLAWNQWPLTRQCLDSLLASAPADADLLVVDNGSTDETPTAIAAYGDRLRYLRLPENLGFVRGMNAGIAAAPPDNDVVLLNNDLIFTQADWLDRLRDAAYAAPEHGIVGCRLLGGEGEPRLFHTGGFIEPEDLWGQQSESGLQEIDIGQYGRTRRVQAVAFALAYLRRDCIDRIGVLDEAFHSYYEDTDYCLRAADAGIASVVAGAVTLHHVQHGSTQDDGGFRQRLWQDSRRSFAARWQQRLRAGYRGTVLWQGTTATPQAHAHLARKLVWRLDARGLRMAYAPVRREVLDAQDFRLELAARRSLPARPEAALYCAAEPPDSAIVGRRRLALAFGDWDRVPAAWAERYAQCDRLLVPDRFQAQAFTSAGYRRPIDVVPLGVDRAYFHPQARALARAPDRTVFLAVVERLRRDAPERLVAAFRAAFHADDPVELLVYIRPGDDELAIREAVERLSAGADAPRITALSGWSFPAQQRAALIAAADVVVSARRGAGWDALAREAIACGRPLIAPAYGSQQDLVETYGHAVEYRMVADPAERGALWADVDGEALTARLREAFAQREASRTAALAQADGFAAAHDLDASADRLHEQITRDGTFTAPQPAPPVFGPVDLARPAGGQLVVLGMHRSGTSSVGGLLATLGAWPGPDERLLRGPDNPKGHYEHADLHMACVRRLAAAGGDWQRPPVTAPAAAIDAFRREAAAVLDTLEPRRPWFIKEPRLCLLARELLPLLTRPVFIHVVRDPVEVAESLARRDGMPRHQALALWERYTVEAFNASLGQPRVLVDYAALVDAPLATAQALHRELVALGVAGLAAPQAERVADWIEPGLRHGRSHPGALDVLTPDQRALQAAIADGSILAERTARPLPTDRDGLSTRRAG